MEIDVHDYYQSVINESLVNAGRELIEESFEALRKSNKGALIIQEASKFINNEICALLGLALTEEELLFTPAALVLIGRHKINRRIFHLGLAGLEAEHSLSKYALKLQESIMQP